MDIMMLINHMITAMLLMIVIYMLCTDDSEKDMTTEKKEVSSKKFEPLTRLKKGNALWYKNGKWYEEKNGKLELYYDENA